MASECNDFKVVCREEGVVMLKYWRVWLLVVMVFVSIIAIGFKTYPYGRQAVEIAHHPQPDFPFGLADAHGMVGESAAVRRPGQEVRRLSRAALQRG